MHIENVHHREIRGTSERVFAFVEALGTPDDVIWPSPRMPFRRTPGPMRVGITEERHGVIRAELSSFTPGREITWRASLPFLIGTHAFLVRPLPHGGVVVTHALHADAPWWFAPVWRLRMGALHDHIIERLFDRLARAVADDAGSIDMAGSPSRTSPHVEGET
jgi:hypothetical protein